MNLDDVVIAVQRPDRRFPGGPGVTTGGPHVGMESRQLHEVRHEPAHPGRRDGFQVRQGVTEWDRVRLRVGDFLAATIITIIIRGLSSWWRAYVGHTQGARSVDGVEGHALACDYVDIAAACLGLELAARDV